MRISDWSSDVCSSDLFFGPVARLHAASLEGFAIGYRGNFAPGILRRQPDFKIVGFSGAKAHVATAQQYHTVGHTQPLQHGFSVTDHFFQRSEEHTSELQSLMRISYAVFCLKKKNTETTYKQQ